MRGDALGRSCDGECWQKQSAARRRRFGAARNYLRQIAGRYFAGMVLAVQDQASGLSVVVAVGVSTNVPAAAVGRCPAPVAFAVTVITPARTSRLVTYWVELLLQPDAEMLAGSTACDW